jgi:hypothetical protein
MHMRKGQKKKKKEEKTNRKVMKPILFSIDVEALGLYGTAFAVGVCVYDSNSMQMIDSFFGYCPASSCKDYSENHPSLAWLAEHVFGVLDKVP